MSDENKYPWNQDVQEKGVFNVREAAVSLVAYFATIEFIKDQLSKLSDVKSAPLCNSPNPDDHPYLQITLMLMTGFMIFSWDWVTKKELKILTTWLGSEIVRREETTKNFYISIAIAWFMVALVYSSINIIWFAVLFLTYNILLTYTDDMVNRKLNEAFKKAELRIEQLSKFEKLQPNEAKMWRRGIQIIKEYYYGPKLSDKSISPQMWRHLLIVLASTIGLVLAILSHHKGYNFLNAYSFITFIIIIFTSEIVIAFWRNSRDEGLNSIENKMRAHVQPPAG